MTGKEISDAARKIIAATDAAEAEVKQAGVVLFTVPQARAILGLGATSVYGLMDSGDLPSVLIGNARRPIAAGVYELVRRRAIECNPVDAPMLKINTGLRRKPRRRQSTPQELAALERANQRRHDDAVERRQVRSLEGKDGPSVMS
jgi:hypothetical protein